MQTIVDATGQVTMKPPKNESSSPLVWAETLQKPVIVMATITPMKDDESANMIEMPH